MNRTQPRAQIEQTEFAPSPSPHVPPAEVLPAKCQDHQLQLIHIVGSLVVGCPDGCVYTYPDLKPKIGV